jgi:hypothetical protein
MNKTQKLIIDFILTISLIGAISLFFNEANASLIDKQLMEMLPSGCEIHITSGYRTRLKNQQVGGVSGSYHLKDRARDFICKPKVCKKLIIDKLRHSTLSVIIYRNHLHVDNRKRPVCLVKVKWGYRFCK